MKPEATDPTSLPIRPNPCSTRCPSIDAAAIFAVANGELSLRREPEMASQAADAVTLPLAEPTSGRRRLQPRRDEFDAADIFELSRPAHPWMAEPIEKQAASEEQGEEEGGADDAVSRAG